ncbi:glycosyltransferase family 61 protein [Pontibacter sp. JH31]|uniref:Glycosyltransferase family 61 protein n=1 Tax=Pontibacter aquaedesilientis TaxID=2766980 RepID=A0ABR7XH83_9BACT|nr:glycosyltransferase family 61 protein [Pontibacter aquaedesilientis]MBD1397637.1 glycosyltransferase family 61 protein [Pontibacter aquaedesilientis]
MLTKAFFGLLHTLGYYSRYTSVLHHPGRITLAESFVLHFDDSETAFLEQSAVSFNYAIDYSLGYRQKAQYVVRLRGVEFLGNSGAAVLDGKVVVESVGEVSRLAKSEAFKEVSLLLPKQKKGIYTSVLHLPWAGQNNYHWFFDCLPRLYLVLENIKEPIKIIMRRDMAAYQLETLAFVAKAYPQAEVVYIGKHEKWQVEEFVLPSFVANAQSGYLPPDIGAWLRDKLWRGYGVQRGKHKKRIFISRANARTRRVLNEQALLPLLDRYGFEVVRAEELTYQQQVQLFYDAEAVIAPHGAGLTNLLFSEQCQVLELHPANLIKTHYFLLCKGLCFRYSAVVGTEGDKLENYTVDAQEVDKWLTSIAE